MTKPKQRPWGFGPKPADWADQPPRHPGATPILTLDPASPELAPGTVITDGEGHIAVVGPPPGTSFHGSGGAITIPVDHPIKTDTPLGGASTEQGPIPEPISAERAALYSAAMQASLVVPLPANLVGRPMQGTIPIPYTTLIVGGVPDFRSENPTQILKALVENRCGLCGRVHGYWKVFLTTPRNAGDTRLYNQPPYHPDCLDYALQVCPWLRGLPKQAMALPGEVLWEFAQDRHTPIVPEDLVMGWTRGYELITKYKLLYAHADAFHHFLPILQPQTPVPPPVL